MPDDTEWRPEPRRRDPSNLWLGVLVLGVVLFLVGIWSPAFAWVPQPSGFPKPAGWSLATVVQIVVAIGGAGLAVVGYTYHFEGRPARPKPPLSDLRPGANLGSSFEIYDPKGGRRPRRRS